MKKILLLLSLLFPVIAFSQEKKFKFGVVVNPNISNNFLSNDGSVPDAVAEVFADIEKFTWGHYDYLFTQYSINARFKIQIGTGYSQSGYVTKKKELRFSQPSPTDPEYSKFFYTYHDIIFPVLLRYNLGRRLNKFYLIGGIAPQVKISRTKTHKLWYPSGEITTQKTEDDPHSTEYRKTNCNGTIGIGYDMEISGKLHLLIQPTFDCNLFGVFQSASLNRRMYTIGLNAGVILK